MRVIIAVLGLLVISAVPVSRAQPETVFGRPGPPSAERSGREHRRRAGEILFRQFRREVREMGAEIEANFGRIRELEEQLAVLDPGEEREVVEERLAGLRRRQAELRLQLARKKAAFSLRILEIAEKRYQGALAELEEVQEAVVGEYPDLADLPPIE